MNCDWNEPFERFETLFRAAQQHQPKDPNQMWLSTVDAEGWPSVRVVLLKGFDTTGFVFFTNYTSHKGSDLLANPKAALNFYWPSLDVQVRVSGLAEKVSAAESDAYFASRPVDSRLGAWASHQSKPLHSRQELEARLEALRRQYQSTPIPRPPHWGGFRVAPVMIEFWKAHPFRLHERERYDQVAAGWNKTLLNP
jgi:pyridoxamine 5'-phosphate oxidase